MDKNKAGLTVGYFLALVHLVWALAVIIMPSTLQSCLDWIFKLHGISNYMTITSLSIINAILLVIVTFISGYIIGWVFAWLADCKGMKKK